MKLIISEHARDDYVYWQRMDKKLVKRINLLIQDIQHTLLTESASPNP